MHCDFYQFFTIQWGLDPPFGLDSTIQKSTHRAAMAKHTNSHTPNLLILASLIGPSELSGLPSMKHFTGALQRMLQKLI